jgi:uncharacterized repeat protein (TIGR01451 family)
MKNLILTVLCAATIVTLTGCAFDPTEPEPQPLTQPSLSKKVSQAFGPGKCGDSTVSQVYPHTGALRIEKAMPTFVQFNAPFDYTLRVTNLTDLQLSTVVVNERLSEGLDYISSTPEGKLDSRVLTWEMDTLRPKASKTITVKVSGTQIGCLKTCADASYTVLACAHTEVVQPALALTRSAPSNVTLCDAIPMTFVVTNEGSGTATNVKVKETLPSGLTTQDGRTRIRLSLGNLVAGQSETRTVTTKATQPGTYKSQAMAVADGNLEAQSEMLSTVVTQPVLTISQTGSKKIYLGQGLEYDITVTNKGDSLAANTVLTDTLPDEILNIKPSDDGVLAGNVVTWELGDLAPQDSKKVSMAYHPSKAGTKKNTTTATATCASAVTVSTATNVDTISAILLEVIDLSDPIEVGKDVTYVITATNQGSAPATNIVIKATLEKSMEYVGYSGTTGGAVSGNTITFEPLPSLAPKDTATWKVVVKASKEGDVRFGVTMNSDELTRDVQETEATKFYE